MNNFARAAAALIIVALTLTTSLSLNPASAESPNLIADQVAGDGVYVALVRNDVDEQALAAAVQGARFDGIRLIAVAPSDPQPDPKSFARRVLEAVDADAAIVLIADGSIETFVVDDYSAARIRATQAARAADDPITAVQVFSQELNTERVREANPLIRQLVVLVVILTLVLGGVLFFERSLTQAKNQRKAKSTNNPSV